MAGTLPPLIPGTGVPVQSNDSNDSNDASQLRKATAITAPDKRTEAPKRPSIRNRLQTLFGWKAASRDNQPIARRFSEGDALPGIPQRGQPTPSAVVSDNGETSSGRSSQPQTITGTGKDVRPDERARPLGILKMLEENDCGANRVNEPDSRRARAWKTLAQTSIGLDFERQVAVLAKQKTQQLIELQAGIARLPPEISLQYQALLIDIVTYRNPAERDAMLMNLAHDVAARGRVQQ